MAASPELSDLQLAIMRVLWDKREASAAEVQAAMQRSRPLAITTVSTLLGRLEKKGAVSHRADGRTFVYRARVSELDMRRKAISGVIRNLFRGNPSEVVGQILSERDVGEADLARMRAMIKDARSAGRRKARKRHDDD
ncbi:MAG TPA: BlaI/MecI/CopY family transcriptional regulator [Gemmatimonadaceae bacterium]|nr:BlaI/MecI/CopY family transcriptional regulator [Gemmatimonadaceae bacterium]